ncbi:sensor histidine kinase [Halioxenophilus aromaticivorans]|uniref:histidine kinase n=1 Tax=Halioxenophilus aromaticivorans TaxID=1306992 RepID=A0AAV3U7N2_9ALTE
MTNSGVAPRYSNNDNYRLLRIYTYYRTALGGLLMLLFTADVLSKVLGSYAPNWFFATAAGYTLLNTTTLVGLWRNRSEPSSEQLLLYLMIDIAALTLLSGTSGGIASGLSYLLVITVAASAIFLTRQMSIFIAALASMATLTESLITNWLFGIDSSRFFTAGALGILMFATALLFQYLTQRIRESSAEAQQKAKEAAKAKDISQKIIERMRTGVLVTDSDAQVQLINNAAAKLLGLHQPSPNTGLNLASLPVIESAFSQWQVNPSAKKAPIKIPQTNGEVRVSFATLGDNDSPETLVFVEDHRLLAQEAQKLKLGSLGKLTASIAHEVRNPLGAISHAAQLLTESPELSADSTKLLNIILNHSQRVNQIIENTLQLSRRSESQAQVIDLARWLDKFIEDYTLAFSDPYAVHIHLEIAPQTQAEILAKIDVHHLQQILTNLLDNGLRYSHAAIGEYRLLLRLGFREHTELARLQVIDYGPGLAEDMEEAVFEPFFTTENSGTGLGLYICRELCQSNQASLSFIRWQGHSCFQINFAHAQQVF